jgi:hypothetical protein
VCQKREIVRRKIPKHIHVRLKQAQVETYGIVVIDFSEVTGIDNFPQLSYGAELLIRAPVP